MRRVFGWTAGLVSIAALARLLGRRHAPKPAEPAPDPADDLRRKLRETRATAPPDREPEVAPPAETIEERRAGVHAKAKKAIDAMRAED